MLINDVSDKGRIKEGGGGCWVSVTGGCGLEKCSKFQASYNIFGKLSVVEKFIAKKIDSP